jgi:hypothetical protein
MEHIVSFNGRIKLKSGKVYECIAIVIDEAGDLQYITETGGWVNPTGIKEILRRQARHMKSDWMRFGND